MPPSIARYWPWLVVLIVLLFVGFIRVRLLEMPLERDEGEYAYAGQLILQGVPPYEQVYNMKWPGTYYAYALGMAVFGQTSAGVHLTLLAANSLTILFVFLLGRSLFGATAGLAACASYGVMSVSPSVLGLAAHANHFVVLFAVPATWLLWKADASDERRAWFISGLLYGLAVLMQQQGLYFCLFGWVFLFWRAVQNKTAAAGFWRRAAAFGLGMILPFGFFGLSCVVAGTFTRFWIWTVTYARWYAGLVGPTMGMGFLAKHLRKTLEISAGFWLLALGGLLLACVHKPSRTPAVFLAGFWLFSFLGAAAGFYFREHYFILVLPAFALLAGLGVAQFQRVLQRIQRKTAAIILPLVFFALVLGWAVVCQARVFFQLSARGACEAIYSHNPFVEAVSVADYIREHSGSEAHVVVAGSEPEIYFYARRYSATGYIYTYALMEPQPAARAMQQEMIAEIEAAKPEYLVSVSYYLSWLSHPDSDRMIFDWLQQYTGSHYELAGVVFRNAAGAVESDWGNLAKNQNALQGDYITVYKRKPDELNR